MPQEISVEKMQKDFADILGIMLEIRDDIVFTHALLNVAEDDQRRRVDMACPYLANKVDVIQSALDDYKKYMTPELRTQFEKGYTPSVGISGDVLGMS